MILVTHDRVFEKFDVLRLMTQRRSGPCRQPTEPAAPGGSAVRRRKALPGVRARLAPHAPPSVTNPKSGKPHGVCMIAERSGVLAAGNFIVDRLVLIDHYPPENTLASVEGETVSSGGCPFTVLKDLALFGATFGLAAIGTLGSDSNGEWIRAECEAHRIDTHGRVQIDGATTSYTYAMTVRGTGRRKFFHQRGANVQLAREH